MVNNLGLSVLKLYKLTIANLSLAKLCFFRKFRPKRFHKIDSRTSTVSENISNFLKKFAPKPKQVGQKEDFKLSFKRIVSII
jgi:hypothetical protein